MHLHHVLLSITGHRFADRVSACCVQPVGLGIGDSEYVLRCRTTEVKASQHSNDAGFLSIREW
jgi:hypothetical protein